MTTKKLFGSLFVVVLGFSFALVFVAWADFMLNPPPPKSPPDYSSWTNCTKEIFAIRFIKEIDGKRKYFEKMEVGRIFLCQNPKNLEEKINKYYVLGQSPDEEPAFLGLERSNKSKLSDVFFIKYEIFIKYENRWISAYEVNVIGESVIFDEKGRVKQFTVKLSNDGYRAIYFKTFVVDWSPRTIYEWFKRTAFLFRDDKLDFLC